MYTNRKCYNIWTGSYLLKSWHSLYKMWWSQQNPQCLFRGKTADISNSVKLFHNICKFTCTCTCMQFTCCHPLVPITVSYFAVLLLQLIIWFLHIFDEFSCLMGDNSLLNPDLLKIEVFIVVYSFEN